MDRVSWHEVGGSVASDLSSADTLQSFLSAIMVLWTIENHEIVLWFCAKESQSLIKSTLQNPSVEIRKVAIVGFGQLFLRCWALLQDAVDLEGICKQSSLSELKRVREDLQDFGLEFIKMTTNICLGEATGPIDPQQQPIETTVDCMDAACQILADLLSASLPASHLLSWCAALEGKPSDTDALHDQSRVAHWLPFVSPVLTALCADQSKLLGWSNSRPGCEHTTRLTSLVVLTLLQSLSPDSPSATLLFDPLSSASSSLFSLGDAIDDTAASRQGSLLLDVAALAEEWVTLHLAYYWSVEAVCPLSECVSRMWEAVELSQHAVMATARRQIAPSIISCIISTLQSTSSEELATSGLALRRLPSMVLLCARSLSSPQLAGVLPSLLRVLCTHAALSDEVYSSSICAEVAMLMIERSVFTSPQDHSSSPCVLQLVLADPWVTNVLEDNKGPSSKAAPAPGSMQSKKDIFKDRLVLALTRGIVRVFPGLLAQILVCKGSSQPSDSHETSLMDGNPLYVAALIRQQDASARRDGDRDGAEEFSLLLLEHALAVAVVITQRCCRCLDWGALGSISARSTAGASVGPGSNGLAAVGYAQLVDSLCEVFTSGGLLFDVQKLFPEQATAALGQQRVSFRAVLESLCQSQLRSSDKLSGPRASLRRCVIQYLSRSNDFSDSKTVLELLTAGLFSESATEEQLSELVHILEVTVNRCKDQAVRRNLLSLLWKFESALVGAPEAIDELTSTISSRPFNSIILRKLQSTRIRMGMSPSDLFATAASAPGLLTGHPGDYEDLLVSDVGRELVATVSLQASGPQSASPSPQFASSWTLLPRSTCDSTVDPGQELGLFSLRTQSQSQTQAQAQAGHIGVSAADVIAIVDDVQTAHALSTNCLSQLHSSTLRLPDIDQSTASELMLLHDPNTLTRLSGSSDPIAVLASASCDKSSCVVSVKVVAINCSGFKIPYFSLESLVRCDHDPSDASGLSASFFSQDPLVVAGDEFFLPNATVSKAFNLHLLRFGSINVSFKVVYSDLQSEDKRTVFQPPAMDGGEVSATANEAAASQKRQRGVERSFTTSVACECLHVGIAQQLVAYGGGAFGCMVALLSDSARPRVPMSVFQAQWDRLLLSESVSVVATMSVDRGSLSLEDYISARVLFRGGYAVQKCCRVVGMQSRVEMPARPASSRRPVLLAWSLQTLWGDEFSVRLSVPPSFHASPVRSTGTIEIRGNNASSLRALCRDVQDLLDCLSGGVLQAHVQGQTHLAAEAVFSQPSSHVPHNSRVDSIARDLLCALQSTI